MSSSPQVSPVSIDNKKIQDKTHFSCLFLGAILWRYRNHCWRGIQALRLLWTRFLCRETVNWSIVRLPESQYILRLSGGRASPGNVNFGCYHGDILCPCYCLCCDIRILWWFVYYNTECSHNNVCETLKSSCRSWLAVASDLIIFGQRSANRRHVIWVVSLTLDLKVFIKI